MTHIYVHHRITTEPLKWQTTADILRQAGAQRLEALAARSTAFGAARSVAPEMNSPP